MSASRGALVTAQELAEALYEVVLSELADLDDEAEVDVRMMLPRPWEVPASVETRMTMGELRRRIRQVRGGAL